MKHRASTASIVAVGARTPVGLTAEGSAAAVRAGISRLGIHPFMVDSQGEPLHMAVDPELDPKLLGWERLVPLAASALREVLEKIGPDLAKGAEVFVALPEARPGFSERDAREIIARLGADNEFRHARFTIAGRGHAGGVLALAAALDRVSAGGTDICIVLGVDSYADDETIEWLNAGQQIVGAGVRSGFVPGEAAGALVVAAPGLSKQLRLPSLAMVRGVHTASETKLIKTDADVLGEGLYAAIAGATAQLALPDEAIDATYCDINGERYRTDEWVFAILKLGATLRRTDYAAPTDCWGDVGAASAVLGCVLAMRAWARGYAEGPRALVWASSEAGLRGAVVLQQGRSAG